ncbi:MAG: PQQ-dependent sugar dehydrogenase [Thermoanaerobaculia bacterium]
MVELLENRAVRAAVVAFVVMGSSPVLAQPPDDLTLEPVAGGFDFPLAIRNAGDGSGRLFVVEQGGLIWIVDGGMVSVTPFLDISDRVVVGGEEGLLGLAFHPDYETNGYFYVNYTRTGSPGLEMVIERYTVSVGDAEAADPDSDLLVLEIDQPFVNHNGGDIHFGPDGYLYIGTCDGGDNATAQDLGSLLGKMLRIDVDGGPPYAIPPDNPFAGVAGALDEIWAWGLRNPFRWSFDRANGDLLIGDVGEGDWEEIDFLPATVRGAGSPGGENFGWPCREGAHDFLPGGPTCGGALVDPVLEYSHDDGCTVIGGYVYRGGDIPGLVGTYVYNDWCSGLTWLATETSPGVWENEPWDPFPTFAVVGYGEGEDGELYVVFGGSISRFHSESSSAMIFVDGFESGDVASWSSSTP